jgi:hypothetical protein
MIYRCKTKPRGNYNTYPIYATTGPEITNLVEAAQEAERQFGSDWQEVSNGTKILKRVDFTRIRGIVLV